MNLKEKILGLEEEIKDVLEETRFMSDIKFHHGGNFFMKYKVFNNQRIRAIIDECCEETIQGLREKHREIIKAERRIEIGYDNEFYVEELTIDPRRKDKTTIMYSILLDLKEGIKKYLANNENRKLIQAYKKLIEKRCRVW